MSAVYRRGVEAEILADNPPHSVQLPNRYPRQMAWKPLSVRPALSIRSARNLGRRIRRPVHSLGLDKPRPLRSPMASTHGHLALPPSWPVARRGTEDHRNRRSLAPAIASSPSLRVLAGGPAQGIISALLTGCLLIDVARQGRSSEVDGNFQGGRPRPHRIERHA